MQQAAFAADSLRRLMRAGIKWAMDRRTTIWVSAAGVGLAALLALGISAQTYLSMLGHGHSFWRILVWQFSSWLFWALVASSVMRFSDRQFRLGPVTARRIGQATLVGAMLLVVHMAASAELTVRLQPYVPVKTYSFADAFSMLFRSMFAIDTVVYVLLLVAGVAFHSYRRARYLEVRESGLEADLARAQLHALTLEIQPHFLFNTLNSISALIRAGENEKSLDMLLSLSELMRKSLDRPAGQLTTVASEMDFVAHYVDLQRSRFGDRLAVTFAVADRCRDLEIPTFIVQPLVENALRHGMAKQTGCCRVEIGARELTAADLLLWVSDDGAGLPEGFDLARDAGTGLTNTASRLRRLYGNAANLRIGANHQHGTTVELRIPV
jgi:two-component system LytT family sensor kinase